MAKFVKLDRANLIINIDKICSVKILDGYYTLTLEGGKDHVLYEEDGIKIVNLLNIDSSSNTFDPDKRISTSTPESTSTGMTAAKINRIRSVVNKHNDESMLSVTMDVSPDATAVTIKGSGYDYKKSIVITNGIITEDSLQGSVYTKLKDGILELL